jgi:hypothetical protein
MGRGTGDPVPASRREEQDELYLEWIEEQARTLQWSIRPDDEEDLAEHTMLRISCRHLAENYDRIFVREQVDGRWQNVSLAKLPYEKSLEHIIRFLTELRTPVAVKREAYDEAQR